MVMVIGGPHQQALWVKEKWRTPWAFRILPEMSASGPKTAGTKIT
jgi:hypothetical protein